MKILVVGGGTAGLVASIIIKKMTSHSVDLVYSNQVQTIGVGEAATEHFFEFMKCAEISQEDMINECDATFKSSIKFKNWSNKDYINYVCDPFTYTLGQYNYIYGRQISYDSNYINPKWTKQNLIPYSKLKNEEIIFNQYNFNTFKFIDFLKKIAIKNNIILYEDLILDIKLNSNGYINSILGEKKEYKYDFYIDCTGFSRKLISKLGAKYVSFEDFLKVNAAVVFQTEEEETYNISTLSTAMDYGWMFKTPVWGRYGNGYIFDKNYISHDIAKEEIQKYLKRKITFGKEFTFTPGTLDKVWINNCCAVGLSASFVEPLEATAISSTIQQCFILANNLLTDKWNQNSYNKIYSNIISNIRDFLIVHYLTKKQNTKFWIDSASIKLPNDLEEMLKVWVHRLPRHDDFNQNSDYCLFWDWNFIQIMSGLDMFNTESIRNEYNKIPIQYQDYANRIINSYSIYESTESFISHKEALLFIREKGI